MTSICLPCSDEVLRTHLINFGVGYALDYIDENRWETFTHGSTTVATHCLGVGLVLIKLGCSEIVVAAGVLHPAYGAESYPELQLDATRSGVEAKVGSKTEYLVYLYSRVSEESLNTVGVTRNVWFFSSRFSNDDFAPSYEERKLLASLFFANIAEQLLRAGLKEHNADTPEFKRFLLGLASINGDSAIQVFENIYGPYYDVDN